MYEYSPGDDLSWREQYTDKEAEADAERREIADDLSWRVLFPLSPEAHQAALRSMNGPEHPANRIPSPAESTDS